MMRQSGYPGHGLGEVVMRPIFGAGASGSSSSPASGPAVATDAAGPLAPPVPGSLRVRAALPASPSAAEDAPASDPSSLEVLVKVGLSGSGENHQHLQLTTPPCSAPQGLHVTRLLLDAPAAVALDSVTAGSLPKGEQGSSGAVVLLGSHAVPAALLHNRRWRTAQGWATGRVLRAAGEVRAPDSSDAAVPRATVVRRCGASEEDGGGWKASAEDDDAAAFLPTSEDGNEEFCCVCWDGGDIVCCGERDGSTFCHLRCALTRHPTTRPPHRSL